jgi:hypothetical protein
MKTVLIATAVLLYGLLAAGMLLAQTPAPKEIAKADVPKAAAPAPPALPTLDEHNKLAVLQAQHEIDKIDASTKDVQIRLASFQQQMQQQRAAAVQKLEDAKAAALRAVNLDPAKYDVNPDSQAAVTRQGPPPASAEQAKK